MATHCNVELRPLGYKVQNDYSICFEKISNIDHFICLESIVYEYLLYEWSVT